VINQLADDDALITADDGTPTVWLVRCIGTNGKRRLFASLLHGRWARALRPRWDCRSIRLAGTWLPCAAMAV